MIESVPALLEKIALWKPRIICFVGKGMWLNAEKGIQRIVQKKQTTAKDESESWSSSPKKRSARQPKVLKGQVVVEELSKNSGLRSDFFNMGFGLRPYKVVHSDIHDTEIRKCLLHPPLKRVLTDQSLAAVRETLFFCSPSSSGLVTSMNVRVLETNRPPISNIPQLAKKIDLYKLLHKNVQQHKAGTIDTSWMLAIPVKPTNDK